MFTDWNGHCHRCGKASNSHSMSFFNTDLLCPTCITVERNHPQYEVARRAECDAVLRGDLNFPGVGKPSDL
jgi:late competence protein required for DNA uptake (superfamily II DNA/RNA helicase)